jgi:hypothetical protein
MLYKNIGVGSFLREICNMNVYVQQDLVDIGVFDGYYDWLKQHHPCAFADMAKMVCESETRVQIRARVAARKRG